MHLDNNSHVINKCFCVSELYLPERCYREDSDSDTGNEEGDNTPLLSYVQNPESGAIASSSNDTSIQYSGPRSTVSVIVVY